MYGVGDYLYCCHRDSLYRINNAAVGERLGTLAPLSTSGAVGFADNGTQLMMVDGIAGYIVTLATGAFAQIADADFPNGATSVTFLDGYFIVDSPSNPGRFYLSALYDGTNWNALAYATAESNPDNLVRPMAERSLLALFGDYSTEVWANTGALDFPFSRMQGAAVEWGLAAAASAAKFDDSLCWLARNRLGQVSVVRAAGLDIQRVSTPELDYLFSTYSAVTDATAFGFVLNGHPLYALSFPTASRTWLYDGKTGAWSEWQSYGLTRHRGATQTSFLNEIMVGDYANGKIYKLKPDVYTDNGQTIAREIVGGHIVGPISEIEVDLETGVGLATGQGSDPQIMLSLSRDGGHSFGVEKWKSAGKIGEYRHKARWRRLGGRDDDDIVPKIRITDPVEVNILGAKFSRWETT